MYSVSSPNHPPPNTGLNRSHSLETHNSQLPHIPHYLLQLFQLSLSLRGSSVVIPWCHKQVIRSFTGTLCSGSYTMNLESFTVISSRCLKEHICPVLPLIFLQCVTFIGDSLFSQKFQLMYVITFRNSNIQQLFEWHQLLRDTEGSLVSLVTLWSLPLHLPHSPSEISTSLNPYGGTWNSKIRWISEKWSLGGRQWLLQFYQYPFFFQFARNQLSLKILL